MIFLDGFSSEVHVISFKIPGLEKSKIITIRNEQQENIFGIPFINIKASMQ